MIRRGEIEAGIRWENRFGSRGTRFSWVLDNMMVGYLVIWDARQDRTGDVILQEYSEDSRVEAIALDESGGCPKSKWFSCDEWHEAQEWLCETHEKSGGNFSWRARV